MQHKFKGKIIKNFATIYLFFILFLLFENESYSQILRNNYNYSARDYFISQDFFDEELLFQTDIVIQKILNQESTFIDKSKIMQADIALLDGNYELANSKLSDFLQGRYNSPLNSLVHFKKGQIYFQLKRYDHASLSFKKSKELARENQKIRNDNNYLKLAHSANYWEAVSAAHFGSYSDAKNIFEEVIENSEDDSFADDALYALGQTAEGFNRYEESIQYYRKIRTDYPLSNNYLRSMVREANNLLSLRKAVSATNLLERTNTLFNHIILKDSVGKKYENQSGIDEIYQQILYLRGEAANIAGNYNDAITYFVSFQETFSKSEIANLVSLGLGWAYLNLENYNKSIYNYDRILNGEDDKWNSKDLAQLYKAIALKNSGNEQESSNLFSLLAVDSDYKYLGEVLLELGQMYYEASDYESAKRTLERADRESIDVLSTTKIYLLLGATYVELKQWQKAIEYYNKAENIVANTDIIYLPQKNWYLSEIRFKRGISYNMFGKSNKAIKDFSAFISEEKKDDRLEKAYFWLAEAYYESELFKNSEQAYNSLLINYPRTVYKEDALYGLAWSYFNQNDFINSTKIFNQLITEFPDSEFADEVLARQADGHYKNRNFLNAAKYYQRVVSDYPNSDETEYCFYQLTQALFKGGRTEQAVDKLGEFAFKYSSSKLAANAMFLKGWIRLQQGRYSDAVANFSYLVDAFPNSEHLPITKYSIGTAYYNASDYENAITAYKDVVESYPASEYAKKALSNIEEALYITGQTNQYIEFVDQYKAQNENSPFYYEFSSKKANTLFNTGRYQEAIDEYESLVEQFPTSKENAEAVYWIARSYVSMEKPEEAAKAFDRLINKFPDSDFASEGLLKYGYMFLDMNDLANADSIFNMLWINYPKSISTPEAGYQRGRISMIEKDTSEAILKFYDVASKFEETAYGLNSRWLIASIYNKQNKLDSSLAEWYLLANQKYSREYASEAQYMLGRLYKELEDYDKAIEELEKVKELYSDDNKWFPQAMIDLGELYEGEDQWLIARETYKILTELFPDTEFGKTAKSRLKRVEKMIK